MNVVAMVGNVTRDAELQYSQGGLAIANVGLAMNDKFKDKEETTFVDLKMFGKTAETAGEYLKKGKLISVSGRLKQDKWEKDGQKYSKHYVIVDNFRFVGGSGGGKKETTDSESHKEGESQDTPF